MGNRTFKSITRDGKRFNLLTLPSTNFFKFEIISNYGANIERIIEEKTGKNVYGLSHLVEHLSFKTSKDYTSDEILDIKRNEGTGNAGTSFDKIIFFFETSMEKCDRAIKFVSNIALNDLKKVTKEEFNTEKKVVYNESKRYHDDNQAMFYFNSMSAIMGHKNGDNVIGYPKIIERFTLNDAIEIKNIFLNHNDYIYNIVYDGEIISEEDMLIKVESELLRHTTQKSETLQISHDEYRKSLTLAKKGKITIENESRQAMTMISLDCVKNNLVSQVVCDYLGNMAGETSLDHMIRVKNGLTYGLSFSTIDLAYKPYIVFGCDVSRGTEDRMEELFKESIQASCEEWTKEKYEKFIKAISLNRTLDLLNQENYEIWFEIVYQQPEVIKKYSDTLATNINNAYTIIDKELLTFENMKENMEEINNAIKKGGYGKITNI